jgi:ABC-2 type transport system permease protein
LTSFEVSLYLLLGITLFGLRLDRINLAGAFLTQLLTILAFSGIGILSASFIVVFKQETPINFLFASISGLLAGVLYPVEVLPRWLQSLSNLLPLTYSLRAMRKAVLLGDSLTGISTDLLVLGLFACLLLPLGFSLFHYAVRCAKVHGSLTQF